MNHEIVCEHACENNCTLQMVSIDSSPTLTEEILVHGAFLGPSKPPLSLLEVYIFVDFCF